MLRAYSVAWLEMWDCFLAIISFSRIFSTVLNFYSQKCSILGLSMLSTMKASGKIPALCMARPCARVLGNPDKMKLFFSFITASISFFTMLITISSFTSE